jgi:hypothetical protein
MRLPSNTGTCVNAEVTIHGELAGATQGSANGGQRNWIARRDAVSSSLGSIAACAVLRNGRVECVGPGANTVEIGGISDALEVSVSAATPTACVRLRGGRFRCFSLDMPDSLIHPLIE